MKHLNVRTTIKNPRVPNPRFVKPKASPGGSCIQPKVSNKKYLAPARRITPYICGAPDASGYCCFDRQGIEPYVHAQDGLLRSVILMLSHTSYGQYNGEWIHIKGGHRTLQRDDQI